MTRPKQRKVVYERSGGWWVASLRPDVPGAYSQGRTKREALENLVDGMAGLILLQGTILLRRALANAPLDDEPYTSEDRKAVAEARADMQAERAVSHAEVCRKIRARVAEEGRKKK